ncbi:MliC family protein [Sphingomonas montana]|uniref:MliC family protein n=1 Tax=Sphingomonas montana TaxID=1843236 RepID=UPI00096FA2F7|nr:MliC family protein [Sphingomonas montana]
MKRLAPLLLLAGCGGQDVTASTNMVDTATPVAASDAGQGARFLCADGRTVRAVFIDPETLTLHIGDGTTEMRSAVETNGARYLGDKWQWWTHGLQQATLSPLKPGETVASAKGVECRVQ